MPLYEYHCRVCGKNFELLRRMTDADRDLVCPSCESKEVERLLSTFARTGSGGGGGCAPGGGGRFT